VKAESDQQFMKQRAPTNSSSGGLTNAFSDEQFANAAGSIRTSSESGANPNAPSPEQPSMQKDPSDSRVDGIVTDVKNGQSRKAALSKGKDQSASQGRSRKDHSGKQGLNPLDPGA
jgi:hypothetical protein